MPIRDEELSVTTTELASAEFEASVRAQMERIETELLGAVASDNPVLREAAQHIISAGGKRFRPHLVVLGSKFGPTSPEPRSTSPEPQSTSPEPQSTSPEPRSTSPELVEGLPASTRPASVDGQRLDPEELERRVAIAAIVVELTHVASLYHDDVMDEAAVRRGSPSANARWGNSLAILVGDYLFSRASSLVTELGMDVIRVYSAMFNRLVHGQIAETIGPSDGVDPLDHYLQVVADKTASLIATSVQTGAMIAGADVATQQRLAEFGEQLGIVFQLSDDIIDITSDETGKTPGTDLREGVDTLAILLARRSGDPADARLLELLDGDRRGADVDEALKLLRSHPAIGQAREDVAKRADAARRILDPLPDGPAKDALAELCTTVVTRTA